MIRHLLYPLIILTLLTTSFEPAISAPRQAAAAEVAPAESNKPPAPPFGPHFLKPPLQPQPPLPPAPSGVIAPLKPRTEVPAGPAFNWNETENYLILGTDRRPGWTSWRTDTVIVVGLDRNLNRAAVFSVPRDLYVEIPGYGWGRINQVDYMGEKSGGPGGGPALISTVLSATLGIHTEHWIRLQMDGFVQAVDAVGGVTMHLDCPFYEPIYNLTTDNWDYFTLPAGDVKLDGETAYWFVRLRYRESDIGRSRRQRQFLWALRDQVMNANLILRLPELWGAFQNTVSTDLSLLQLIELVRYGTSLDPANVRAGGLTLSDLQSYTTSGGAAVLRIADPAHVRAVVEGVWSAAAMADAYRQDENACPPLPAAAAADIAADLPPVTEPPAEPISASGPLTSTTQ